MPTDEKVPKLWRKYRLHINPLKPTGHVMHQKFNIQQMYALPTLYLCVLCLSENKQRLVPLTDKSSQPSQSANGGRRFARSAIRRPPVR
jgi:hypothetical protein